MESEKQTDRRNEIASDHDGGIVMQRYCPKAGSNVVMMKRISEGRESFECLSRAGCEENKINGCVGFGHPN